MFEDFVVVARSMLLMLAPAVALLGLFALVSAVIEESYGDTSSRVIPAAVFAAACAIAGYAWFCLIS